VALYETHGVEEGLSDLRVPFPGESEAIKAHSNDESSLK
jgi:hypothetical protein